jgi:hypothetical protein
VRNGELARQRALITFVVVPVYGLVSAWCFPFVCVISSISKVAANPAYSQDDADWKQTSGDFYAKTR